MIQEASSSYQDAGIGDVIAGYVGRGDIQAWIAMN